MEPKTTSARNSLKTRETSLCPDGAHPEIESQRRPRAADRHQRRPAQARRRGGREYIAYVHGLAGTEGAKSERSVEDVEANAAEHVVPQLGHQKTADIAAADIRDLALCSKTKSRSTVLSVVSEASGFFRSCVTERYCDTNPVARARERTGARCCRKRPSVSSAP
jgi:hypothetical protein